MYIHEIGSTAALPSGAALTAPTPLLPRQDVRVRRAGRARGRPRRTPGPTPGPAAAVRDAERLVQVQVRDVAAEGARRGDADEGVHVGAVDVHAPAVPVDDGAELLHPRLEHAVGGGVGDHDRGQPVGVRRALRLEVARSTLPSASQRRPHRPEADHLRARRVGAVRRFRG
jgi:hypothetical protein